MFSRVASFARIVGLCFFGGFVLLGWCWLLASGCGVYAWLFCWFCPYMGFVVFFFWINKNLLPKGESPEPTKEK